jgi:U32 family peptidase
MNKQTFNNNLNVELMAPVGSFESMVAAINASCDSIYFGITKLNMRAKSSSNFDFEDLDKIAEICGSNDVKTYLTLNTLLYDNDLQLAYEIIDRAKEADIDAVIASDMAAILYANKMGQPVHISTQLSVSNIEAIRFYAQYSNMIVLARELTLPMVKQICEQVQEEDIRGMDGELLKIEIFGHGAICVAVSGRCHMSLLTHNSSAQRGACVQNCRREYIVTAVGTDTQLKLENNYVMSPSDLCTIGLLDELVATGISTLKIEGRGRKPDYVDTVITCYREALDAIADGSYTEEKITDWNTRLGTVYNRGMSGGFYMGKPFIEWSGVYGNKATKRRERIGVVNNYYAKVQIAEVRLNSGTIMNQDEYLFTGVTTGVLRGNNPALWVDEQEVQEAQKGDIVTFKVGDKVRRGDHLYKLMDS